MKLFIFYLLTFVLAGSDYYILRRGVLSKLTPRPSTRSARIVASAEKPKRPGKLDSPHAGVSGKGPADIYYKDGNGDHRTRYVPSSEISLRRSTDPRTPTAGGYLKGAPTGDEPLKVDSSGKYAAVSVVVPPGGSGKVKIVGDGGVDETVVEGGTAQAGVAHRNAGNAKAYASVSRPGEAHALGWNSDADLDLADHPPDPRPDHNGRHEHRNEKPKF